MDDEADDEVDDEEDDEDDSSVRRTVPTWRVIDYKRAGFVARKSFELKVQ